MFDIVCRRRGAEACWCPTDTGGNYRALNSNYMNTQPDHITQHVLFFPVNFCGTPPQRLFEPTTHSEFILITKAKHVAIATGNHGTNWLVQLNKNLLINTICPDVLLLSWLFCCNTSPITAHHRFISVWIICQRLPVGVEVCHILLSMRIKPKLPRLRWPGHMLAAWLAAGSHDHNVFF